MRMTLARRSLLNWMGRMVPQSLDSGYRFGFRGPGGGPATLGGGTFA